MARSPVFTSQEDRHFVFNASHQRLNCFHSDGKLEWHIEARGIGNGDSGSADGNTPPGLYKVGMVEPTKLLDDSEAYGPYRIALIPVDLDKGKGRDGIFIHGGGSKFRDPFAPTQGWESTLGCIRVQNRDLGLIVNKVNGVHGKKGQVWLTVKW